MRGKKERFALPIIPLWPSEAPPPTSAATSKEALLDAASNSQPIVQSLTMSATLESTGTTTKAHTSAHLQQNAVTALDTVPIAATARIQAAKPKPTTKPILDTHIEFRYVVALLLMEHPDFAEEAAAVAKTDIFTGFELNRYMTDGSAHMTFHADFTDPVEMQFRSEMNALRCADFRYFTVNFDIERATKVLVNFGENKYTNILIFKVFKDFETPRLIAVRLFKSSQMMFVQIRWASTWHPLSDFLDTMVNDVLDYEKLWKYWEYVVAEKAKKSILNKLPLELRRAIYRDALLPGEKNITYPYIYLKAQKRPPFGYPDKGSSPHNLNVLLLNKKLGNEAAQVLYDSADFTFLKVAAFNHFFKRIPEKHLDRIRKITLEFPCEEFQRVMASTLSRGLSLHISGIESMNLITNQLTQLTIRMQAPSTMDRYGRRRPNCHTAVVQWILERLLVLLPALTSAKLKIEGLIKDAQKARFMQYMKDAEKGQVEWRYPDETQEWPYTCRCIHRCSPPHYADFEQNIKADDDLALGKIVFRQMKMKMVDGELVAADVDDEDLEDREENEDEKTNVEEGKDEYSFGWW